jgi:NAD-dependent deacetylase
MMPFDPRIELAAALLRRSRHAIALTGAGISTPSGIPDFRTPGQGLWERADPMEVASIHSFRRQPEHFYNWVRPMVRLMWEAQPNPAHVALAELEKAGCLKAILTQNIDGLHQRAGSRRVLELHGHLRAVTCLNCFHTASSEEALEAVMEERVPTCSRCDGVVKPDVVLFGEQLPSEVFIAAMEEVRAADLVLVAGSSLQVVPVSKIPALVHSAGGEVVIVNNEPTYADDFAAAVFHQDVATILPRLTRAYLAQTG